MYSGAVDTAWSIIHVATGCRDARIAARDSSLQRRAYDSLSEVVIVRQDPNPTGKRPPSGAIFFRDGALKPYFNGPVECANRRSTIQKARRIVS
jgi:hypothetical protein